MLNCIAKRDLLYSDRIGGNSERRELVVRVFAPFDVQSDTVNFTFDEGTAGCGYEISGLPEKIADTVYGADSIQALQLASDIDPILRALSDKYEFYFPTGEPYFDD